MSMVEKIVEGKAQLVWSEETHISSKPAPPSSGCVCFSHTFQRLVFLRQHTLVCVKFLPWAITTGFPFCSTAR